MFNKTTKASSFKYLKNSPGMGVAKLRCEKKYRLPYGRCESDRKLSYTLPRWTKKKYNKVKSLLKPPFLTTSGLKIFYIQKMFFQLILNYNHNVIYYN